ncbi:uncharacterized protein PHALS_03251 [Plasmopara halstedii]|uniref:RxLR-like protein n=1 Tax=Plasmopara halstedii TaxID=4781 RepID=A0A0P1AWA3_PLAHL|nr:uncharacterized protein PHALS_03251 [Plasmopara halstedii]CEG46644.1 hypothetical protein PHALS_03251 [Plasmopara halstedii]|eukprot:XP_024583013.1 hypothetical protein PHALS_03251 [Plasmopara halstedii]
MNAQLSFVGNLRTRKMKVYQSLLAAALLLSRIEASYTIDKEQEKTGNDDITALNLRVHFPTMEERGINLNIIEKINAQWKDLMTFYELKSDRTTMTLHNIRSEIETKKKQAQIALDKFLTIKARSILEKESLNTNPAKNQLEQHSENSQHAHAPIAPTTQNMLEIDKNLKAEIFRIAHSNLRLNFHDQQIELLNDLRNGWNNIQPFKALKKYMTDLNKLETNRDNLYRSYFPEMKNQPEEPGEKVNPLAKQDVSRSPQHE